MTAWHFIRLHFGRMVIGLMLMAILYSAICVVAVRQTDQREQRIAREIAALGGTVRFEYCGPNWIPQTVQSRFALFNRIHEVCFWNLPITDDELEHVKGLGNLERLQLSGTQVTDTGLEDLNHLKTLIELGIDGTQVTDAGLNHLTKSTRLRLLCLFRTQTTVKERTLLRKALPNCEIYPNP